MGEQPVVHEIGESNCVCCFASFTQAEMSQERFNTPEGRVEFTRRLQREPDRVVVEYRGFAHHVCAVEHRGESQRLQALVEVAA